MRNRHGRTSDPFSPWLLLALLSKRHGKTSRPISRWSLLVFLNRRHGKASRPTARWSRLAFLNRRAWVGEGSGVAHAANPHLPPTPEGEAS